MWKRYSATCWIAHSIAEPLLQPAAGAIAVGCPLEASDVGVCEVAWLREGSRTRAVYTL